MNKEYTLNENEKLIKKAIIHELYTLLLYYNVYIS